MKRQEKCPWGFDSERRRHGAQTGNGDRQSDRRFLAVRNDLRRWSECGDLNPGPHGPEPCALPSALHPEMLRVSPRSFYSIMTLPALVKNNLPTEPCFSETSPSLLPACFWAQIFRAVCAVRESQDPKCTKILNGICACSQK